MSDTKHKRLSMPFFTFNQIAVFTFKACYTVCIRSLMSKSEQRSIKQI
ncbi:hypothetical protein [uncultured Bacteroides sp.]